MSRSRLFETGAPGKTDLLLVDECDRAVVGTVVLHAAGASQRRRHAWTLGISVVADR